MADSERFHYRTNNAVIVTVTNPAGATIPDTVTVKAGLGTAYRPPAENTLTTCSWLGAAASEREFSLRIEPSAAPTIPPGVYFVWFRLSGVGVSPLSPLLRANDQVVIYGTA